MKQTLLKSQNNLKNKQSNIRKNNIKDRNLVKTTYRRQLKTKIINNQLILSWKKLL